MERPRVIFENRAACISGGWLHIVPIAVVFITSIASALQLYKVNYFYL